MNDDKVVLVNWAITGRKGNGYVTSQESVNDLKGKVYLSGYATGHPRYPDNQLVYTTRIVSVEGRVAKTRNTEYFLGSPEPTYIRLVRDRYPHVTVENCFDVLGIVGAPLDAETAADHAKDDVS